MIDTIEMENLPSHAIAAFKSILKHSRQGRFALAFHDSQPFLAAA